MGNRIQGDPAQSFRGIVPLTAGHPRVCNFVEDHGKEENADEKDQIHEAGKVF
jgi:hypothetical protein